MNYAAAIRIVAIVLVPLFIANIALWWPISKFVAILAIALLCLIPTALRFSIDD